MCRGVADRRHLVLSTWLVCWNRLEQCQTFSPVGLRFVLAIRYLHCYGHWLPLDFARVARAYSLPRLRPERLALVEIIPELVLGVLWIAGFVHPTISQPNGSPMVLGHGITDLCIRAGVAVQPTHMLLVPLAAAIPAAVAGALGAMSGTVCLGFPGGAPPREGRDRCALCFFRISWLHAQSNRGTQAPCPSTRQSSTHPLGRAAILCVLLLLYRRSLSKLKLLAEPHAGKVKIVDIKAMGLDHLAGNCLIRIDTDSGLTGYGEAGQPVPSHVPVLKP